LDLANILSNPKLGIQKVPLDVAQVACGDLRDPKQAPTWLARPLQAVLRHECPAILDEAVPLDERGRRIREFQEAQTKVMGEEIARAAAKAPSGLKLTLAVSVRDISFQTGDLAADCFHPSIGGHTRIANKLLANELRLDVSQPH
jgi:hypothetical protein